MRKVILASIMAAMTLGSVAVAQDQCPVTTAPAASCWYDNIDISLDAAYVTKYMFKGYDKYDGKAAFQPSANFDFNNGFSFALAYSVAGASGDSTVSTVNREELKYIASYANSYCIGQCYQADYKLSYTYYEFPDMSSEDSDMQQIAMDVSMPNMLPYGLIPHYEAAAIWNSQSGADKAADSLSGNGWFHTFGLAYDYAMCGFLPNNPEQKFTFTWDIVYNDGYAGSDHDWSHMTWGVSTPIALGCGTFTPAVYYQNSFDDSVNTEDELYAGFTYSYSF